MSQNGSVHGALVYKIHALSCQVVHTVCIHIFFIQKDLGRRFLYIDHGLKHDAGTVLNELAHRVKISGQINGCGEQTPVVLTLAFAEKLLPPLGYIVEAWLIVCHDLYGLSLAQQDIADCGI